MGAAGCTQRGAGQRRLLGGGASDGRVLTDRNRSSGDNLVTGNFPEEDDVDHRVEPQSWLPEGAAGDQGQAQDQPSEDGQRPSVLASKPAEVTHVSPSGDTPGPAVASASLPYPASIPTSSAAAGTVASALGVLTRPGKAPKAPKAPKPPRPPKAAKAAKAVQVQAPRQAQNGTPPRRAQLAVVRLEPWSVMKFSFMISLVGWVVLFVAVAALYFVLSRLGVFHSIETSIENVTSGKDSPGVKASNWFSASRILGYTMLIGAVNVILITALSTVGAVIYNLVTHVAGGIEVTLRETD